MTGGPPKDISEDDRDYFLERRYPELRESGTQGYRLTCGQDGLDEGRGVGPSGQSVYLDFADCVNRKGVNKIREEYGNLFDMYYQITDEDGYQTPMRIFPPRITPWAGCGWTTT